MLKYLSHKLRTQSITEDSNTHQEKIDGHDSGTESDGPMDEDDKPKKIDMGKPLGQRSMSTRFGTCSSDAHTFLSIVTSANCVMYDQHSSEDELEVINGPISNNRSDEPSDNSFDVKSFKSTASVAIIESRKRSLAQSLDEELGNLLECAPVPVVNLHTSPPLEALKPHPGNIIYRSATPLIITESGLSLENIKISCDSPDVSMDTPSFSPPAKLFHCSVSPRRRQISKHGSTQRSQRSHRPCLDFDKMQQLKSRSLSAWRQTNDHPNELPVFSW